jgi:hypothetical protein
MARRVIERVLCDMHGTDEVDASTERNIVINGTETRLDLCDGDAKRFDEEIGGWLRAGERLRTPRTPARQGRPRADKEDPQVIRDWARRNGHQVSDRGRVPTAVADAYRAAN